MMQQYTAETNRTNQHSELFRHGGRCWKLKGLGIFDWHNVYRRKTEEIK